MKTNLLFLIIPMALLVACGGGDDPEPTCDQSDLAVTIASKTDDQCGQGVGEIDVAATGGEAGYEFSIDGTAFQSGTTFTGLEAGNYTITVRDGADCTKTASSIIANIESGISLDITATDAACGISTGSISVEATGGEGDLQYSLDEGTFGTSATFDGIGSGVHVITVKDETGCETTEEVLLTSGISFSESVASIIENNCATASCHSGAQAPDFRQFTNIKANAADIKLRTGNGQMPPAGREDLTEEEKEAIACWVNDGALDN